MNPYHKSNQKYPKPQKREVEKHFDWLTFRVLDFLNNVKASYINLSYTFGYNSIFFFGLYFLLEFKLSLLFKRKRRRTGRASEATFIQLNCFCVVSRRDLEEASRSKFLNADRRETKEQRRGRLPSTKLLLLDFKYGVHSMLSKNTNTNTRRSYRLSTSLDLTLWYCTFERSYIGQGFYIFALWIICVSMYAKLSRILHKRLLVSVKHNVDLCHEGNEASACTPYVMSN